MITAWAQCYKPFLSVIYELLYYTNFRTKLGCLLE
jgi:hypothetical protein